jgi:hypothetical protein
MFNQTRSIFHLLDISTGPDHREGQFVPQHAVGSLKRLREWPIGPIALTDEALGVAWWNGMTRRTRLEALKAVEPEGRVSVAKAWEHWKKRLLVRVE